MHAKLTLVLIMLVLALPSYRAVKNWQKAYAATGALPTGVAIQSARRWAMRSSHLMLLIPVFAVLMANGYSSLRLW